MCENGGFYGQSYAISYVCTVAIYSQLSCQLEWTVHVTHNIRILFILFYLSS